MERRGWIVQVTEEKWAALKADVNKNKSDDGGYWEGLSDFFDYYGCFKKGALCVDIVYRDVTKDEWIICADGYILGEDTGYGYTKDGRDIPYDMADGFSMEFYPDKTYEEMIDSMIDQIESYIEKDKYWKAAIDRTDLVWEEDM